MSEVSLSVRNLSFLSRGLMYGGGALVFALLLYLSKATPIFLIAILIFLFGLFLYIKTPKSKIVILGLDGDRLNYTSCANPFFAVGKLYEESDSVKLDDIVFIELLKQYVHDVGHYLHIKLYLKDVGAVSIWIEAQHTEKTWGLIRDVLTANENIKIFLSEYKEVKYIFSDYSERFVDSLPEGESFEPWKINISKKKLFSDEEWQELSLVPICIFCMIAKADGEIHSQEINVFVNKLKESEQYKSFFVAEVLSSTLNSFDLLFDEYKEKGLPNDVILKTTFDMLLDKIDKAEVFYFSQALIELAKEIARITGEKYKWLSDEEEKVLDEIREILPLK